MALAPGLLERALFEPGNVFEFVVGEFAYGCDMLPFCVRLPLPVVEDVLPIVLGEPVLVVPVAPAPPAAAPPAEPPPPAAAKASVAGAASSVAANVAYLMVFSMMLFPFRDPERERGEWECVP